MGGYGDPLGAEESDSRSVDRDGMAGTENAGGRWLEGTLGQPK